MRGARLIVNADDFGLSEAIDRGIVGAHRDGIVTSASIMACGPAFEHAAAATLENPGLDIGVHLALTELVPVSSPESVPSLVDASGRFPPHAIDFAHRYLRGSIDLADVRRELDAQIRRLQSRGIAVSHLDSHQHVHALPGIARTIAELADAHGIQFVRYPRERLALRMLKDPRRFGEQVALNAVCAWSPLRRLRHPDRFVGFHCDGRLSEEVLAALLRELPEDGTAELMCHPAEPEPDGPQQRWGYAGSIERAALTSPRIRALVRSRGIALIGYREL